MRWQLPRRSNDWALWLLLVLVTLVVLSRAASLDDPTRILAPVHPDPPWALEPPPRILFPAQRADDDRVYEEAWR